MAARAYWSGHLRLSLVSVPVRLYSALTSGGEVRLNQIHRKTGQRVRHQNVVPEVGPVAPGDIVKGYEYEKGRFVTIEDDEIAKLKVESKQTVDIVQFVESHEIDPMYFDKPYFVVPDGAVAEEAFGVVREALRQSRKTALGQITLAGREHIAAIRPCGQGMILETLRYADEVKKGQSVFAEIGRTEVEDDQLALATQLIEKKSAPFDPSRFKDHYQAALRELIDAKVAHRRPEQARGEAPAGNVVNLMEALKRSVREEQASKAAPPRSAKARAAEPKVAAARRKKAA